MEKLERLHKQNEVNFLTIKNAHQKIKMLCSLYFRNFDISRADQKRLIEAFDCLREFVDMNGYLEAINEEYDVVMFFTKIIKNMCADEASK